MADNRGSMRLVKILETQVQESDTSSYEVGEQRERNHRYYALGELGNEKRGRSQYISPDVMDAVEGKKAIFSESFLSARDVVKFRSCGQYPTESEQKTAYVNNVMKRNQYERMFRDGWHDAFVAKRMVVLAEWFEDTKEQVVELQGTPVPVLQQQMQQMGADIIDANFDQTQVQNMPSVNGPIQVISGQVTLTMADGYVKYTLVQPERYFRDPDAAYADESQWVTVEEDITRGQLIDQGYDPDQVDKLAPDYRFRSEEEDSARKRHDSSWTRRKQHNRVDEQETVSYYRTWTWLMYDEETFGDVTLDFEPGEGYRLYEIHWSHGEVLMWADGNHAIKEVPELGVFEWSEMKISHAENGLCTADVMAHNQKTVSTLKRLIIDNQQIANSSRMLAISGAVKNPRDLLDNTIGAHVWSKRPDAVTPLAAPVLSPMTMQTVEMLKRDGEERSGISGLAKGMNTDAVKYQNSSDMIERLTTAGQRRVTAAARDFANTFLVPLAQYTAHLGMRNDKSQDVMEIAGQQVPIVPASWQDEDLQMDVAVALTPDEGQRTAQQLLMMNTMMTQDPSLQAVYGVEQKHALLDQVFDLMGIADTSKIMLAPSDPKFQQQAQQQSQMAQMEKQKQDQMLGVQMQSATAQIESLKANDQLKFQQFDWSRTNDMADNLLDERKFEHTVENDGEKIELEEKELELERTQNRNVSIG